MEYTRTAKKILVTGASGYIGGRLAARLISDGLPVRLMARRVQDVERFEGYSNAELVQADVMDASSLAAAMEGVDTAYYLIHSMAAGRAFETRDELAARQFAAAAKTAGVERIIYLGGLGDPASSLSSHLQSRQTVGRILAETGVAVTEFRAAVIVGAGSLSFEMLRYLTERIPVLICPRWVFTRVQPIGIDDVLAYLAAALHCAASAGRIIEIGGADVLTYADLMREYARQRRLRRWIVRVPVLTPTLSSYWVHLVTPVPSAIAVPLIQGLKNEVVVRTADARQLFPAIAPEDYAACLGKALQDLHPDQLPRTSEKRLSRRTALPRWCLHTRGFIVESQTIDTAAAADAVFGVIERIGGQYGWFGLEWAWRVRGLLDRVFGGQGYRKIRPDRPTLNACDTVDFFSVERIDRPQTLLLKVGFKLPGEGWFQFETTPSNTGSRLSYTVYFAPRGLRGLLYWYGVLPFHRLFFARLLTHIAAAAQAADTSA